MYVSCAFANMQKSSPACLLIQYARNKLRLVRRSHKANALLATDICKRISQGESTQSTRGVRRDWCSHYDVSSSRSYCTICGKRPTRAAFLSTSPLAASSLHLLQYRRSLQVTKFNRRHGKAIRKLTCAGSTHALHDISRTTRYVIKWIATRNQFKSTKIQPRDT